jgi:SET domain-containing protein
MWVLSFYLIMNEIFKDIPDYEGIYQVSNLGNVKSIRNGKEKILSKRITSRGYVLCSLFKNGELKQIQAHQLVAITFLGHKPDGHKIVVDHIDNNKLNNRLDNLQLISQRENILKDRKSKSKYTGVVWHEKAKKWMARIKFYGKSKYLGLFKNEHDAHLAYQNALKQLT